MQPQSQLGLQLFELRSHSLGDRESMDLKSPAPGLPTDVGETKKLEGLGLSFSPLEPVFAREASEFDQAGLVRM
jgi:hypothetical protein